DVCSSDLITSNKPATICKGLSATLEANSVANPNYSYFWSPINVSGQTVTVTPTAQTAYVVEAIDSDVNSAFYGCYTTDTFEVFTSDGPPAEITPAVLPQVCPGVSQLLQTVSAPTYTYQWSHNSIPIAGATTNSFLATTPGNYRVTIYDSGCDSTSTPVQKADYNMPNPGLTYNSPLEFCDGSSVTLNSNGDTSHSYQWYLNGSAITGATANYYVAKTSGVYHVIVSNAFGCVESSNSVSVTVHPLPNPIIVQNGMVLSVPTIFSTYQWYRYNQALQGANQSSFTLTQNGVYTVEVTNSFGCKNRAEVVVINNTSVQNVAGLSSEISVYPNPTKKILNIEAPIKVNALLQSMTGQILIEEKDAKQIDVSHLAEGVYMVSILDSEGQVLKVERIVKTEE